MKLFIQNLCDKSDILWLRATLEELHIKYEKEIQLNEVHISPLVTLEKLSELTRRLQEKGFTIIHDRKKILVEQIKLIVLAMLQNPQPLNENYSDYICKQIHLNYTYLANIFSELEGFTIEQFIIIQKIEKAKQLLSTGDHSIGHIADMLHYSSIGHFSNQFKKITGLNPSVFKKKENKTLRH